MPETARAARVQPFSGTAAEWDAFVHSAAGGTFCHLSAWRGILADVMGHEPHYLAAHGNDGSLAGVLPMARLRSPLFGKRLVSMPLLNYGGPLGDARAVAQLLACAQADVARSGARLELRTRDALDSTLPVASRKVTVLLPLPESGEALWSTLKSKLRSQVRRPLKEGLEARFGAAEVLPFYDVYCRNMRDLGTPALPRRLFERVRDDFGERVIFAAVYQGDVPVAAAAGFLFGGEFEITWASSLREYSASAPNMLLYWALMEEVIRRGANVFNFGRCTPGEGTHRFKLQWGGYDQPLPWLVWPQPGAEGDAPGRSVRLASELWQKLPVTVANRLGPLVARQLPWW